MKRPKRLIILLLVSILAAASFSALTANAWVGDRYETETIAFESIMREMKEDQGYDYETYTYEKSATYTTGGALSGYAYGFTLDGERDGYVLMIATGGGYEVTEIFVDTPNPFAGNDGVNIYPTFMQYVSYKDGKYYDLKTGAEITAESVVAAEQKGFGFNGGGDSSLTESWTERVYYDEKNVITDQVENGMPGYGGGAAGTNTCAPDAGMHLLAYWDVYNEDLIPNCETYILYMGYFFWKGMLSEVADTADELYDLMETNQHGAGTSISWFKTGLTKYAQQHGNYSVTYRSTMQGGAYSMSKMLSEFAADRPVVMFLYPQFNFVIAMDEYDGYDYIAQNDYDASHTMVAYGRQINQYYQNGELTREITFLKVASALQSGGLGWVRLNAGYLDIEDSFSVEIS